MLSPWILMAQTPSNDKNWIATPLLNSDFTSGSGVLSSQWSYVNPWNKCMNPNTCQYSSFGNIIYSQLNKSFVEELSANSGTYVCNCGNGNITNQYNTNYWYSKTDYKYGYFEIMCKAPVSPTSGYSCQGFAPQFWLFPLQEFLIRF